MRSSSDLVKQIIYSVDYVLI